MRRLFAAVLAAACVVGASPGFARGSGFAHGSAGFAHRDPVSIVVNPVPQMPALENRIPAPLPAPPQAPVINGPLSSSPLRGM